MTLTSTTKNVTVDHPVYFVKNPNDGSTYMPSVTGFNGYAWTWVYRDTVQECENILYFCFKDEGDSEWKRVHFGKDTYPSGAGIGDYCYLYQKSMLYRCVDTYSWRALDDSTQEKRVVSLFGAVWSACQRKDKIYKGLHQYYTIEITNAITSEFGDGSTLPVGNYLMQETNS